MKLILKILKGIVIVIVTIILIITLLNIVPFTISKVSGNNIFRQHNKQPLVIPHGGAKDLAPENTIYAYDMLVNQFNADVLEIDVALTKDNILIAHHDLELEFSENSPFNDALIQDLTYQQILDEYKNDDYYLARQFQYPHDIEDGSRPFENEQDENILETMVPAHLEKDIFAKVGDSVYYILEIKDSPSSINYIEGSDRFELAAQTLIDLIYKYDLEDHVVLASFSDEVTAYFDQHAPGILMGAANDEVTNFTIISAFYLDFFWPVKSEVLILPNQTSMSPITGGTADLLDKLPNFITKNIGIKDEETGGYKPYLTHQQIVDDAHRKNMAVIYWTINDPDEMRHLIELGADGIITDRPDLLNAILTESDGD